MKERIGRLLKMHANKREEIKDVYAGDIAAAVGLKNVTTGDTICDPQQGGGAGVDQLPRPRHRAGRGAQDQGRPGEARPGPGQADAGRPHLQGGDGPRHRPDQDLRHGRAAPRDHRGPAQARVRGGGQRGQAAGRLQGDDPQARQGRGPLHQADGRPRPVRPRQDRARARARRGLRVRERDHRAAASPRSSSSRSRRASGKRWSAGSWPATRWWTCG